LLTELKYIYIYIYIFIYIFVNNNNAAHHKNAFMRMRHIECTLKYPQRAQRLANKDMQCECTASTSLIQTTCEVARLSSTLLHYLVPVIFWGIMIGSIMSVIYQLREQSYQEPRA
jgi:membrane protein required for beta-lactamase induction